MKYKFYLLKNVFDLEPEIVKHIETHFNASIQAWDSPKYYIYVCYDKNDWIGYGCLRHHESNETHSIAYSGPTFVKTPYRGQGLQTLMIKKRIRLAKKLGYHKLISSTFMDNYPSCNSLIKCGFRLIGPWSVPEPDSLYWERVL